MDVMVGDWLSSDRRGEQRGVLAVKSAAIPGGSLHERHRL